MAWLLLSLLSNKVKCAFPKLTRKNFFLSPSNYLALSNVFTKKKSIVLYVTKKMLMNSSCCHVHTFIQYDFAAFPSRGKERFSTPWIWLWPCDFLWPIGHNRACPPQRLPREAALEGSLGNVGWGGGGDIWGEACVWQWMPSSLPSPSRAGGLG